MSRFFFIYFDITGVKKIVHYTCTKDFVIQRFVISRSTVVMFVLTAYIHTLKVFILYFWSLNSWRDTPSDGVFGRLHS